MALMQIHGAFDVPGHERDLLLSLVDEDHPMHSQALIDAVDTVGLEDAQRELDQLQYAEWLAAQREYGDLDEYEPTIDDHRIAAIAACG